MVVFDDVLLIELDSDARVCWRYQTSAESTSGNNSVPLPFGLARICCPGPGKCQKRGTEFTFTISDGRSRQLYGYVKQMYQRDETTQVACILGSKPLYVWFAWILRLVHARLLHDPTKATTITLLNAIRSARTDLTKELVFSDSFVGEDKAYTFPLHPLGEFGVRVLEPHILNYRSFTNKLQSPSVLLVLLSGMLFEQRIILVHDENDLLSGICQLLLRLIAPFVWKHLLIPVLPPELIHYAAAPIPYLLGMNPKLYTENASKLTNVIVLHLESGKIEFRQLIVSFPTLCEEYPTVSAAPGALPFTQLCSSIRSSRDSTLSTFRQDLSHSFKNDPESLEACFNAFLYHIFADASQFLRYTNNGLTIDLPTFVSNRKTLDVPFLHRFVSAFAVTPLMAAYCSERLGHQSYTESFHGSLFYCIRTRDYSYQALCRQLHRRGTNVQEYPKTMQLVNGMWNQSDRFYVSLADVRPLLDATYHMDHCGIVIDMLWERLADSNDITVATALQILVYLILDGCEIVTEYLRFKECQRNHCRMLKRHSYRGIVHGATQLLDFINNSQRLYTIRTSNSLEHWISKLKFPRVQLEPRYVLPSFQQLHHSIGRFQQPVNSVDLLNLDFDAKSSYKEGWTTFNNDPFDCGIAEHWR